MQFVTYNKIKGNEREKLQELKRKFFQTRAANISVLPELISILRFFTGIRITKVAQHLCSCKIIM